MVCLLYWSSLGQKPQNPISSKGINTPPATSRAPSLSRLIIFAISSGLSRLDLIGFGRLKIARTSGLGILLFSIEEIWLLVSEDFRARSSWVQCLASRNSLIFAPRAILYLLLSNTLRHRC